MTFADIIECSIDFDGQRLADQITYILLIATGVVSFIVGYALQSIQTLLIIFAAGLAITTLVVVPPWPMYNKHPQPWIEDKDTIVIEKKD
ncbi:unnamed protein product [Mucor hiemalis]